MVGRKVALLRHRKGLSLRELAQRVGADKNTIQRLERGSPVRMETLHRICSGLGTTPGRQLLQLGEPGEVFRISRAADRRWEKDPELMSSTDPSGDIDRLGSDPQRWRLGWLGKQGGFNGFLDCELYGGTIVSSAIELFRHCNLRSFPGEELIYCLKGPVAMRISDEQAVLETGDAVTLWAEEPHSCGPTTAVEAGQPPPMILSVRVERYVSEGARSRP